MYWNLVYRMNQWKKHKKWYLFVDNTRRYSGMTPGSFAQQVTPGDAPGSFCGARDSSLKSVSDELLFP